MLYDLRRFVEKITHDTPIIGIDMGTKRIGIAVSDKRQKLAMSHLIYIKRNNRKDMGYINELYNKLGASGIIIGVPFSHAREDKWIEKIEKISFSMIKIYNLNICLVDESWSTQLAESILYNKRNFIDSAAAVIILQGVLNLINDLYR